MRILRELKNLYGAVTQALLRLLRDRGGECKTIGRSALLCTRGSERYIVIKSVVEEVAQSIETLDPRTLLMNIKRFVELLTSEKCMVLMSSLFQRREDEFLKRIELELQHRLIELESDRANTRLQREIILLKTLRDKILRGYTPLFSKSSIVLICDARDVRDEFLSDYVVSLSEKLELASSILSIKLRISSPSDLDFFVANNFRQ